MGEDSTYNNYTKYDGPGFTKGADDLDLKEVTGRMSIFNMYKVLSSYMVAYEKGLSESIKNVEGSNASEIDQGTLLQLQAMVQTWGTVAAVATGTVRTVGDTLMKITQNIR
ncbi:MAG: hypothetical protein LBJ13_02530 [Puniceicoccales bacterium]|jgi:hypothetical protein|nr:hypothetical protein [Puniceicoccales bacterium]